MNRQELSAMNGRLKYECEELFNRAGQAITAFLRIFLVLGMLTLLAFGCFLGLLDEQLPQRNYEDSNA